MTNKEKYKKAFSTLHASDKNFLEVDFMEKNKKAYRMKKTLAACAAVSVIFGSMTAAYAADLGGIQEKLTIWLHGEQTQVNVNGDGSGNYTYTYTDEDGNTREMGAGGVAFDENGNEIPLPAEDVLTTTNHEVDVDKDGRIWLYYYDQKIDITDQFEQDGICRVAVTHAQETAYFTIQGNGDGGYAYKMTTEQPDDAERFSLIK